MEGEAVVPYFAYLFKLCKYCKVDCNMSTKNVNNYK